MQTKDKVWLIVEAMLDGKKTDDEIVFHSGNRLSKDDLDQLYKPAENVVWKAKTKPEVRPQGEDLIKACRQWLNYYDWEDVG